MAIKSRNKVSINFSMSGMSDIVFLLLIFFMITSTLIHPNALKLLLPKSGKVVTMDNSVIDIKISKSLKYYINDKQVNVSSLESELVAKSTATKDAKAMLTVDENVPIDNVVRIMNIAKNNDIMLSFATTKD